MSEKFSSQERIFAEMIALGENHVNGMANNELAKVVGTSETNMCRDLAIFEKFGMVERNSKGKWRLSPKFGCIAGQIAKSYQKARLELSRDEERYANAMQ